VNRRDLQRLAEARLEDARVLLASRRYAAAYYLAGYAIECGLKVCIALQIRQHEYPPRRNFSNDLFSHDFNKLVSLAQLDLILAASKRANSTFAANWSEVEKWSEDSRYETWTMQEAQQLLDAVDQVPDGVLAWIRQRW
jgi:HEPN domain-containing protein